MMQERKKKLNHKNDSWGQFSSPRLHPKRRLDVFIHHVADADRWDDLEEVRGQAAVEASGALGLEDLLEQPGHGSLGAAAL